MRFFSRIEAFGTQGFLAFNHSPAIGERVRWICIRTFLLVNFLLVNESLAFRVIELWRVAVLTGGGDEYQGSGVFFGQSAYHWLTC